MSYRSVKITSPGGVDYRSSDVERPRNMASDARNAMMLEPSGVQKRFGFYPFAVGYEPRASFVFNRRDPLTGDYSEELLFQADSNLYRVRKRTLSFYNIPSNFAQSKITVQIVNGDTIFSIGNLFSVNLSQSAWTYQNLADYVSSALSCSAQFESAPVYRSTTFASSLVAMNRIEPVEMYMGYSDTGFGSFSIDVWITQQVPGLMIANLVNLIGPFSYATSADKGESSGNTTFVQINDVCYIGSKNDPNSSKFTPLMKYDGLRCYMAGLGSDYGSPALFNADGTRSAPTLTAPTITAGAAGSVFPSSGVWYYKYVLEYTDPQGNYVETEPSAASNQFLSTGVASTTISNCTAIPYNTAVLHTTTNFNATYYKVVSYDNTTGTLTVSTPAGGTTGTSFTVEAGQNICVNNALAPTTYGDNVIELVITAVTDNVFTVRYKSDLTKFPTSVGAIAVGTDVSLGATISIYRTTNVVGVSGSGEGRTYYLWNRQVLAGLNGGVADLYFTTDTATDAQLGEELIYNAKVHNIPPIGSIVSSYLGRLVIGDTMEGSRNFDYSDEDGLEIFPLGDNELIIGDALNRDGSAITGIATINHACAVFTKEASYQVTADPSFTTISVANTSSFGCSSPHSLLNVQGSLFWSNGSEIFLWSTGLQPAPFAYPSGVITQLSPSTSTSRLDSARIVAAYYPPKRLLIFTFPYRSQTALSSSTYSSDLDRCLSFVFDTNSKTWFVWDNFDAIGGMVYFQKHLVTTQQNKLVAFLDPGQPSTWRTIGKYSGPAGTDVNPGLEPINPSIAYNDAGEAIDFRYATSWEALNEPSINKNFERIRVWSTSGESQNFTLSAQAEADYVHEQPIAKKDMDFNDGRGWGSVPWGNSAWGSPNQEQIELKLNNRKAKAMRVVFSNSDVDHNVHINGWEWEIAPPYQQMKKR